MLRNWKKTEGIMIMKKINIHLYGTASKSSRCNAQIISCDKSEICGFYKKGQCLNVSAPFSTRCEFGNVQRVDGYTQRARAYSSFMSKYKSDECYAKLQHPHNWTVQMIGNIVVLNLKFAVVDKKKFDRRDSKWVTIDVFAVRAVGGFSSAENSYIDVTSLTSELLNSICNYRPQAMMGGTIASYRDEVIPNVLYELSRLLPKVYEKLVCDFPVYKEVLPDHVGKNALVSSLRDGVVLKKDKYAFTKKGNSLFCEDYYNVFNPFDAKSIKIEIPITSDLKFRVTNNNQVDENVVFV